MPISALFAFLHFVAAFTVFATVFYEWLTLSRTPTLAEALRLQRCDMWYGLAASAVVVVGLLRVFVFEKGSAFYAGNPFFWTKIGLFATVGLLSIYPTVQFLSWRKQTKTGAVPMLTEQQFSLLRTTLRLELVLLLGVMLSASLMARGVGS
jgi:putative membrane protein